jgi:phage gp36-like protein
VAESLTLTVRESAAVSASGSGTAVEIEGRQRVARLDVEVSAFTGTSLVVTLQRRPDTSAPWETTATATIAAVGRFDVSGAVGPLTRVSWTLTGSGSPSATFGVRGMASTVYAEPADLPAYACKAEAIQELASRKIVDALIAASSEADGYLAARYTMPIVSWDEDLRMNTAKVAASVLFNVRGADPNGPDALIFDGRNVALRWFDRVQAGRLSPAIVDSTPTTYQAGIVVSSRTRLW